METMNDPDKGFLIEQAQAKDIPDIAALDERMWSEWANPPTLYRQLIDLYRDTIFVARTTGGEYAGCIVGLVRPSPLRGWVLSVDIEEKYRGRGLGKLFLRQLLFVFEQLKIREVTAIIDPTNTPSQKLFASIGFEKKDTLAHYFSPEKDQQKWELSIQSNQAGRDQ